MTPGFHTFVMALATIRALPVKKGVSMETGKKFGESGKKVTRKWRLV